MPTGKPFSPVAQGSVSAGKPAREGKQILNATTLTKIQEEWLEIQLQRADFSTAMRLYYYLGVALGNESYVRKCFETIQQGILKATMDKETAIKVKSKTSTFLLLENKL